MHEFFVTTTGLAYKTHKNLSCTCSFNKVKPESSVSAPSFTCKLPIFQHFAHIPPQCNAFVHKENSAVTQADVEVDSFSSAHTACCSRTLRQRERDASPRASSEIKRGSEKRSFRG